MMKNFIKFGCFFRWEVANIDNNRWILREEKSISEFLFSISRIKGIFASNITAWRIIIGKYSLTIGKIRKPIYKNNK